MAVVVEGVYGGVSGGGGSVTYRRMLCGEAISDTQALELGRVNKTHRHTCLEAMQ